MNTRKDYEVARKWTLAIIGFVLVASMLILSVFSVNAQELKDSPYNPYASVMNVPIENSIAYPESCRTFYLWSWQGGIQSIAGLSCSIPLDDHRNDSKQRNSTNTINLPQDTVTDVTDVPEVIQDVPPVDNPPSDNTVSNVGNPGNDKPVGNAGEHCDKGMCEQGNQGNRGKGNK